MILNTLNSIDSLINFNTKKERVKTIYKKCPFLLKLPLKTLY